MSLLRLAVLSALRPRLASIPAQRAFSSSTPKLFGGAPNRAFVWCVPTPSTSTSITDGLVLSHNCKQPGHFADACPRPRTCHACGGEGHMARDCPSPDPEREARREERAWCVPLFFFF